MPWKAHRSQCERETLHVLLPTVARNALAGQGESVCVLQVAFIQALCFYSTSGTLSHYFAVYYFPCWNWVEHPSTIHYLKTLQIEKKKKGWVVLCMCPLWHHKGCDSRTRRKKREKQTKRRLTGCSWLFYLFMCLSIYIFYTALLHVIDQWNGINWIPFRFLDFSFGHIVLSFCWILREKTPLTTWTLCSHRQMNPATPAATTK